MLSVRLGARNLTRHRWRTGLTLAGIAVAVALMVWSMALTEGWMSQMVRAATTVETGQLTVQTAGWTDKPRPYEALDAAAIGAWVHGKAADCYRQKNDNDILRATDLLSHISENL